MDQQTSRGVAPHVCLSPGQASQSGSGVSGADVVAPYDCTLTWSFVQIRNMSSEAEHNLWLAGRVLDGAQLPLPGSLPIRKMNPAGGTSVRLLSEKRLILNEKAH